MTTAKIGMFEAEVSEPYPARIMIKRRGHIISLRYRDIPDLEDLLEWAKKEAALMLTESPAEMCDAG